MGEEIADADGVLYVRRLSCNIDSNFFKLARETNGIHEYFSMWLFDFLVKPSCAAALNALLDLAQTTSLSTYRAKGRAAKNLFRPSKLSPPKLCYRRRYRQNRSRLNALTSTTSNVAVTMHRVVCVLKAKLGGCLR